ncbi:extracellular solute-binding protein [Subtercola sp. YIM 133946]|uniref:extracellular solute-binding protein n=1 Tax=Subtercola sp. YIM 133946 TaxID=3118909 RepID=UPI002F95BE4A
MTQQARRFPRHLVAALAAAAGLSVALAGCSGGGTSESSGGAEPQTLTLSYQIANSATSPYSVLAQKYMASHPGVTITTNAINLSTYGQTLTTQLQAGNGPDVFQVQGGSGQVQGAVSLANAGLLAPLTGTNIPATIPDGSAAQFSVDGKQYAMPVELLPTGIIYNDAAAKGVGITLTATSTLEDVYAACATASAAGKSLFALAGSQSPNTGILAQLIAQSQVYEATPDWNQQRADGKVTFANTPGWKSTLQTVVDMNTKGCFQPGAAGAGFDALTNGVGSTSATSFGLFAPLGGASDIMSAVPGLTLVGLPVPAPAGTTTKLINGADDSLAINAKTKSPNLAQDFLNWMAEPEQAAQFASVAGEIPIVGGPGQLSPVFAPITQMITDKQYGPFPAQSWPNGQVYDALGTGVTGLITGQATIDQVLQSMDDAWGA